MRLWGGQGLKGEGLGYRVGGDQLTLASLKLHHEKGTCNASTATGTTSKAKRTHALLCCIHRIWCLHLGSVALHLGSVVAVSYVPI